MKFRFAKDLKALLNPATSKLHTAASELDLFDTQGSLQHESNLVSQVLEVIRDLEAPPPSTRRPTAPWAAGRSAAGTIW